MQKNLVLAIVLSSAVYILWYSFIEKRPMLIQPPDSQTLQTAPAAGYTPSASVSAAAPAAASASAATPLGQLEPDWASHAVELKLNKAVYSFHPAGASIKSVVYQGPVSPVELVINPSPGFLSSFDQLPFTLKNKTADSVTFETRAPNGVVIQKKYVLSGEDKINLLEITATNPSSAPAVFAAWDLKIGPGLGTVKSEEKENAKLWKAQYTVQEEGRKFPTIKTIKEDQKGGPWIWAGVNNRYFLAAVLGGELKRDALNISMPDIGGKKAPLLSMPFEAEVLAAKETRVWRVEFYIGPKDYKLLQALGHGLDRSVDFGFFAPIAKLANSALDYFHGLTGNYGAAIVILSILLQILISPLSWKSYKAMAVMKKIQPEMQSIQARYKDDPKRMNAEVMELYKRHGTNPLGGCLPMLLQIPVFFSLFTALRNSWPLHGAPFIFWIKDLSAKDPYYVLPIVMGGIMFLQQQLNPQGGDPAQAAMMKWMPVVFTFMFLTFPSGLVLYWLINSTWGFAQMMILKNQQT